jgi:hypothetical protein
MRSLIAATVSCFDSLVNVNQTASSTFDSPLPAASAKTSRYSLAPRLGPNRSRRTSYGDPPRKLVPNATGKSGLKMASGARLTGCWTILEIPETDSG